MADHFDLLIRGGTLVDGTGAPARRGDLGIRGGRIAALGDVGGTADRTLDAEGAVVAPGFVDIHTHYDAQVFWDRMLSISPWHGVTTVVMGNCGFGVAPTRPAHRELVLRTLERVEGMSLDALLAGIGRDWPFESFAEFLDTIEARGTAINVGALVGHTPVRLHVLGDEASEREATPDEIATMRGLVRDALRAGALGFATSKSPTHVGDAGRPVPSRAATLEEIEALASALGAAGHGVMQATIGPGFFLDELSAIARATRRPVTWTALLGGMLGPEGHRFVLERSAALQAEGVAVIPQVSCRPLTVEFQLKAPFPLESMSLFRPVSQADHAGKRRIYADPEFRRALRERSEGGPIAGRFSDMQISEHTPDPALVERRLSDVAAERGVHPTDLMLDLALASDLETRFRLAVLNTDPAIVAELLAHPASMLGLSDAGAHASQLCDACAPTELLGSWVRERGVLSLEDGVRRLTGQPAEVFGLADRGRLAPGLAADVAVFDPATVGCSPLRRVWDFPGGTDRLVSDAHGIRAVIVNGAVIREEGRDLPDPEGPLPGHVLRGGRPMNHPVISADSHVTEPPEAWSDIDPAFRDRAPRIQHVDGMGDIYVIEGLKVPIPLGIVAAAGKPAEEIRLMGTRFEDLHRGGWDPEARIADQVRDGVAAEVIYPTVGMAVCNHRDADYKQACMDAYNRWMAAYCEPHRDRLLGVGQTPLKSPAQGIRDLESIKALGLRGVMLPGNPVVEDYDSPAYDEFWEAAIALGLPLSFHILTTRDTSPVRGPKMNAFLSVIRGCQDIMGTLVLGGVFERHPTLRVVCVEADAGWVPHYMYRMDHAWKRHRNWLPAGQALTRLPSEWFAECIYTTFQDDWVAFRSVDMMNWRRLMWANDFPHSDSTWPWSQDLLAEHATRLTPEQHHAILCGNVAELYGIDLGTLH